MAPPRRAVRCGSTKPKEPLPTLPRTSPNEALARISTLGFAPRRYGERWALSRPPKSGGYPGPIWRPSLASAAPITRQPTDRWRASTESGCPRFHSNPQRLVHTWCRQVLEGRFPRTSLRRRPACTAGRPGAVSVARAGPLRAHTVEPVWRGAVRSTAGAIGRSAMGTEPHPPDIPGRARGAGRPWRSTRTAPSGPAALRPSPVARSGLLEDVADGGGVGGRLVPGDQGAGDAVVDDVGQPAGGRRHHRQATGLGLGRHQPERLGAGGHHEHVCAPGRSGGAPGAAGWAGSGPGRRCRARPPAVAAARTPRRHGARSPRRSRSGASTAGSMAAASTATSGALCGWILPTNNTMEASSGNPSRRRASAAVARGEQVVVDPGRREAQALDPGAVVLHQVVELGRGRGDDTVGAGDDLGLGQRAHRARRRLVPAPGDILDPPQGMERVGQGGPSISFNTTPAHPDSQ